MARHVVIGAGPIGSGAAIHLADAGHDVRVVTRSGSAPTHPGIEAVVADAADANQLTRVTVGAAAIYNCANPPYTSWATDWPPMAAALLTAAEANEAVLVTMSNLYGYGPGSPQPMTEDLPLAATGPKGQVRAQMWLDALAAHQAGRVRITEARASDFFGPTVMGSAMGDRVVPRILAGKRISVIGDADALHSWTFADDAARALTVLGTDERALGRAWHVPSAPACSARQLVATLAEAASVPAPKVSAMPNWMLKPAGIVVPMLKELRETAYQFESPFVIDATAAEQTFGLPATPLPEAAARTVAWWRSHLTDATAA